MKKLLMGNEAAALGALRAGVRLVAGYPGTPSTEILETAALYAREKDSGVYVEWSVNEKAALEVAAGAAMAGARALVTMKQVGLNVASDPLMSLNYLGVQGGLVVAVADDPGPLSSQTEQDTRRFAQFAKLALFDPSSPEEAYLMMADAFACSEKYRRPVLFRPTTRVCHSYASVEIQDPLPAGAPSGFDKSGGRWVIFPSLAYRNHLQLEKDLAAMGEEFSSYRGNLLYDVCEGRPAPPQNAPARPVTKGLAAGGVSWAYTLEALEDLSAPGAGVSPYRLFKAGVFPLSEKLGLSFLDGLLEVLVLEELDPVIEDELIRLSGLFGIPVKVRGKYTGDMPRAGEYTAALAAETIRAFLSGNKAEEGGPAPADAPRPERDVPLPPPRPPVLCAGCPHRASFFAVKEAFAAWARNRAASPPSRPPGAARGALPDAAGHPAGAKGPPPRANLPPPAADLPPPAANLPPPAANLPPPAANLPPPAANLPPPAKDLPPPAVDLPPPAANLPPPVVDLPPPEAKGPPPYARELPPPVKPKAVFSGDIGCYTLGNAPPLDMTDTCLCMGAGITVAQGLHRIEPHTVNFAFIGDSTFFHTGIPGIVNAVYNRAGIIAVILDNGTTAMTGNQPHPGTGKTAQGLPAGKVDIYAMLAALGVGHIERANPFHQKEAREAVRRALDGDGVRAILFEAPCVMVSGGGPLRFVIDGDACTGCGACVARLGCPAMSLSARAAKKGAPLALIDASLCTGCGVCGELCAFGAIGPAGGGA